MRIDTDRRQGALSCAHWLSWRIGLELGAAREHVRVARAVADLPLVDDALRQGLVSYSKGRPNEAAVNPTGDRPRRRRTRPPDRRRA